MRRVPSDAEWVNSRVNTLPPRWERRLRSAWERRSGADYYGANVELREATEALLKVRVPLDASDMDICEAANQLALQCVDRLMLFRTANGARDSMERVCQLQGIEPPPATTDAQPALARMCCSHWWRRKLRKHQGQSVEATAVRLGYVSKARDLYVSDERVAARLQQNRRNAAALEATVARNEEGQTFTLAELAKKSTANKAIRRAELMTRIAGFERYADAEGHQGVFLTITCPSRFHRYMTVNKGAKVLDNPRFDAKETPRTAHAYLVSLWARARAALARRNIKPYGFRIAEPQHDGTPHWHLLLFCPAEMVEELVDVIRSYALEDSPDEAGAAKCAFH